ncbi:flagellar biosynthesis protein FlhF [Planococcus sp. CAU13]|uniref:flagellar biosynthesis protein FlhF n=1 Tax=Planococcus sp. CAU13 TaxID=1541197 RepID=UPI00052FFDC7|nr:flagellar biosynthesis protein FlhF [Planococcus sp. CAU13]
MRLKTYIVQNVSEALPMIKRDLGADALILNTKKVKVGGFIGFFQKEKLEVTAAVEAKPQKKKAVQAEKEPVQAAQPAPPAAADERLTDDLINELKGIKQFMMQSMQEDHLPASLKPLNQRLCNQEVTKEIQSEILSKMMLTIGQQPDTSAAQIHRMAKTEIIRLIEAHQQKPAAKDPEIICFIGPTGVGKTTTIAKIAADLLLREGRKVGLITSDTYRIAAVEQLKTYAGILNIPIEVVDSAADLNQAMDKLNACDIILMDTAGRNYQQKQYIDDLEALLADKNKIQINLVLSLTSKYEDMKKIIDNFQTIKMDQLLLTKQDETSSSGAILNLIYHYSIPVTYIANGQNVPDDILTATPELIANFVLGENDND